MKRLAYGVGAVAVVGTMTWLWVGTRSVDVAEHEHFDAALRELRRLDRTLDADVLRARFQLINTYDPLVATETRIAQVRTELETPPAFLSREDRVALQAEIVAYDHRLDESQALVESFKSQNAVLKNSLRYLPTLAVELAQDADAEPGGSALAVRVRGILEQVLVYNLTSDESYAPVIEQALTQLLADRESYPEALGARRLDLLVAHVRVILRAKPEVDGLVHTLIDLPMGTAEDRVANTYALGYTHAAQTVALYRAALYGFAVVLLVLVAAGLFRLRRALADLAHSNATLEKRVAERTDELSASMNRFKQLVESTRAIPWEMDLESNELRYVAPQAATLLGYSTDELRAGRFFSLPHPDDREHVDAALARYVGEGGTDELQLSYRIVTKPGVALHVSTLLRRDAESPTIRGLTVDITREAKLEVELRQAQKLEAVGRLAAGVAHEINTPIQFVGDSLHFVRDAARDLLSVAEASRAMADAAAGGEGLAEAIASYEEASDVADVDYLRDHLPKALERSLDGLARVADIVRSMKEFAHPDQHERVAVDINRAIESTLTIARNEYKYVADIDLALGDVPHVVCHPGEINQVILNLVVNAAHAIGDVVGDTDTRGRIAVRTRSVGDAVEIQIEDSGAGIPEAIRERIFDPFFTTKAVGKGTGQGLAIARSIIVDKHKGTIRFDSTLGQGTTFVITLPGAGTRESAALAEAA